MHRFWGRGIVVSFFRAEAWEIAAPNRQAVRTDVKASTFKVSTQITFCNFRRGSGLSAKLAPGGSTVGTRLREVQCGFGVFRCWSQRPWVPAKVLGSDLVPVEVSFENFIENFGGKFPGKKSIKGTNHYVAFTPDAAMVCLCGLASRKPFFATF